MALLTCDNIEYLALYFSYITRQLTYKFWLTIKNTPETGFFFNIESLFKDYYLSAYIYIRQLFSIHFFLLVLDTNISVHGI